MELTEVADGVFFAHTRLVNWVVLVADDAVTLVDTGYPGQREQVVASVREAGRRPEDVEAVLLTHAHVDHVGSADWFAETYGARVLVAPAEVPHARRETRHGLDEVGVVKNLWRPRMLPWLVPALAVGAASRRGAMRAEPFPDGDPLPVPGRPVAVPTPGHTPGHTAFWLPSSRTVVTGDALGTAHPLSGVDGPQLLPACFDDDREAAVAAVDSLICLGASTVLPGHGPVRRGSLDAVTPIHGRRAG